MKLLISIVNNDDASAVNSALNKSGYSATKIASTGGFLLNGNTTFLVGVDDEEVDKVIEVIKHFSKQRDVQIPVEQIYHPAAVTAMPAKVTVGGATIFVIDVEKYIHI